MLSYTNFSFSENAIVFFFLMEYLVRFVCSPRKWRFFKQPMNLVDFFAIIPFMLDLVIGGLQVCTRGRINLNFLFWFLLAKLDKTKTNIESNKEFR